MLDDRGGGTLVTGHSEGGAMESKEKSVVRRYYEIVAAGRPEELDEVMAAALVGHAGAGANLQEHKESVTSFLVPFPDMTPEIPRPGGRSRQRVAVVHRDAPGRVRRRTGERTTPEVRRMGPDAGP